MSFVSANAEKHLPCEWHYNRIANERTLIIASNRGPVTISQNDDGELEFQKASGGLVTALSGIVGHVDATWIASASTPAESEWKEGRVSLSENANDDINVEYLDIDPAAYNAFYNVISNPLLWFLQHSMWDFVRAPNIDLQTWEAWEKGYVAVNRQFANTISNRILNSDRPTLVMIQDYHLYLAPMYIRRRVNNLKPYTLMHFVHIPWPGPEDWGILPPTMRLSILEGLTSVDLLGFQTRGDALNFIRTCESFLPRSHVNFKQGRIWHRNHATHVRDFPISIDVDSLRRLAESEEVEQLRQQMLEQLGEGKLIVRVDRIEPSKNIVRGFQAFGEMLEMYPEHREKVKFIAVLVPSRMQVEEYRNYLDELMAAAGRINAEYGSSDWEPVRVLVGEDYSRAIAALQLYDVLLVNPIADGMNLVAKEGPIVNQRNGAVVLSERAGAHQQLEPGAIIISPCDIYATAEALHQGLTMPDDFKEERARRLTYIIENADINDWFCNQLKTLTTLNL